MDVNLWGTLQLTQVVAHRMRDQGDGGRVVMVNSMSAVRVQERFGAYMASKAALAASTKSLAKELGRFGIRVNGVHPGYIWGDSRRAVLPLPGRRAGASPSRSATPRRRPRPPSGTCPTAREIAGAVLFLASDLAKPITGQALHVNAGHWFEGF